ncbi:thiol:disulfide interchange protein DsbA/DsbL [Marinomonas epiphytica]
MNKLLSVLLFTLLLPFSAMAADYSDGNGYTTIKNPVRTEDPNKIEVVEIFWYGCPHCYSLEPITLAWAANAPEDVDFKFMPAVFGRGWVDHAKAFYVADILGIEEDIRADLFNTIHQEGKRMNSEDALASFFVKHGVNEDEFHKLYNSFAVNSRLKQADAKIRAYGARGVPGIIVNGKYMVTAQTANGNNNIYKVVDFLIEKERNL